jgi:hypothetical protein
VIPQPDQTVEAQKKKSTNEKPVKRKKGLTWLKPLLVGTAVVVSPFLLFGLVFGLIAGLKSRKRKKRRTAPTPAKRVSGAWDELVDRARDTKLAHRSGTLLETAAATELPPTAKQQFEDVALIADRAAFHPVGPTEDEAEHSWRVVDAFRAEINNGVPTLERIKRTLRLGTVFS